MGRSLRADDAPADAPNEPPAIDPGDDPAADSDRSDVGADDAPADEPADEPADQPAGDDHGPAPASYQLPARPMSGRLALPPAPDVLEGRRLLWRDTSILLLAIAIIAAVLLTLGVFGAPSPTPVPPAGTSTSGARVALPGEPGRAWAGVVGCYTSGAPVSER